MGYIFGYFFSFLCFSIYLVILHVDLGPLTFVIGDFGVFFSCFGGSIAHDRVLETLNPIIQWICGFLVRPVSFWVFFPFLFDLGSSSYAMCLSDEGFLSFFWLFVL